MLVAALRAVLPPEAIVEDAASRAAFDCDGLTAYREMPPLVVLPADADQVSAVLRLCHEMRIKVVPRGSGTSLSGGAMPHPEAILLVLARLNRIIEIDIDNQVVVAQPGVTNLAITHAVADHGFYYAPDPSSQIACSIGGNVAENSGGVHCLKHGLTVNNICGLEICLIDGTRLRLGGRYLDAGGYDLLAAMTGSEGLLAVVTEVTVRVLPAPETSRVLLLGFPTPAAAGACVAAIIAAGIVPAGMEMMDALAARAADAFVGAGYPPDAGAILLIELDGPLAECAIAVDRVSAIAREVGATSERVAADATDQAALWAGRKAAFPAVGRIAPDYYCMDGTIPRGRLPEVLEGIAALSDKYGLAVANVFHAGDGNLHPLILYDADQPGELHRAEEFGADILRLCVSVGGVLTGEHGVGIEKRDLMPLMFDECDLAQQMRLKCAFDPDQLLNPGKVFPTLHRCAELGRVHVHGGQTRFPDLPRF